VPQKTGTRNEVIFISQRCFAGRFRWGEGRPVLNLGMVQRLDRSPNRMGFESSSLPDFGRRGANVDTEDRQECLPTGLNEDSYHAGVKEE